MAATLPKLPKIKPEKEDLIENPGLLPDEISYSSKLASVEAQRIMAVIQEIQKKVALIGIVPETMTRTTSSVLSGDALSLLKVLWRTK